VLLSWCLIGSPLLIYGQDKVSVEKKYNAIDSIKNDKDAIRFVTTNILAFKSGYHLANSKKALRPNLRKAFRQLQYSDWGVFDLDGNGWSDLVLNGYDTSGFETDLIIFGDPCGAYHYHKLPRRQDFSFTFYKPIMIKGSSLLLIMNADTYPDTVVTDTVVYCENSLVLYNASQKTHHLEKLEFLTVQRGMTGEAYDVHIDFIGMTGTASAGNWHGWKDTIDISNEVITQVQKILEYVNFTQFENSYTMDWTDCSTVVLQINYDGDRIKHIEDYGQSTNYSLMAIYAILERLIPLDQYD
jgi:hypothetical protein